MPVRLSTPLRTSWVWLPAFHQPLLPSVPVTVAVVTGGVRSTGIALLAEVLAPPTSVIVLTIVKLPSRKVCDALPAKPPVAAAVTTAADEVPSPQLMATE